MLQEGSLRSTASSQQLAVSHISADTEEHCLSLYHKEAAQGQQTMHSECSDQQRHHISNMPSKNFLQNLHGIRSVAYLVTQTLVLQEGSVSSSCGGMLVESCSITSSADLLRTTNQSSVDETRNLCTTPSRACCSGPVAPCKLCCMSGICSSLTN